MGRTLDKFMIVKDNENLIEVNGHRFYTKVGDVGFFRVLNRNTSVSYVFLHVFVMCFILLCDF